MATIEHRHEAAVEKILDNNPGLTPERLGSLLYDAVQRGVFGLTEEVRRQERDEIARARRVLFDLEGGRELYELEEKLYKT